MKVKKTVQGGIVHLTKVKKEILTKEYNNLQQFLHGDGNVKIYSANKQQAKRYYKKVKKGKEYPISIRKDLIDVQRCNSNVCDYFVKLPIASRRGGVKVPVNTHMGIEDDWEICESKLYRKNNRFYINILVEIEVEEVKEYKGVLGIDLGLRNPVVSVALPSQRTNFQGQGIKQTQAKYFYLRRKTKTGKGWKRREHNKVKDELHKITTKIANFVEENKLIVAVGNLSGIQKHDKGRKMNRKMHNFPHYSFRLLLKYKCKERGIKYLEINEAYTSKICSFCEEMGNRNKGEFKCPKCGLEINSDINGAKNIAGRALGKFLNKPLVRAGAWWQCPNSKIMNQPLEPHLEATSWEVAENLALAGSTFL